MLLEPTLRVRFRVDLEFRRQFQQQYAQLMPYLMKLTLCGGTDNNLAHINIVWLLDREHTHASDRIW